MKSLLQDQVDMDILDQAELGLLGDRLEIGQIALLAFPNSRKHQRALEEGIVAAIEKGSLSYALCIPRKDDLRDYDEGDEQAQHATSIRFALKPLRLTKEIERFDRLAQNLQPPKFAIFNIDPLTINGSSSTLEAEDDLLQRDMYWVKREQLRAYFIEHGEWPLSDHPLLRKWLEQSPTQKISKAPDIRTNELHELIKEVMQRMAMEYQQSPKARQVWDYLRKRQQDIDLIQEVTADKILWVSSNGIERTLNFSSFKTRFSALKKELFEETDD
jgi:hypothetical protein